MWISLDQIGPIPSPGLPDHSGLWGFARAVRMEYPGMEHGVDAFDVGFIGCHWIGD